MKLLDLTEVWIRVALRLTGEAGLRPRQLRATCIAIDDALTVMADPRPMPTPF